MGAFINWIISFFSKPAVAPAVVTDKPEPSNTYDPTLSTIPSCGIALIKSFEKCRLVGYADDGGVATDGFGNTFGAKVGVPITQAQADADLIRNLSWAWLAIKKYVKVPLTQNQAGCLLSFIFNVGEEAFLTSSVLRYVNASAFSSVPLALKQYNKIRKNGVLIVSDGLVNRRKAEALLWCGGDWRAA